MKWLSIVGYSCSLSLAAQEVNKNPNKSEPPVLGPHWTRGAAASSKPASGVDMSYHGGPILPSTSVKAIFWGSSWPSSAGDKITGLDKWYTGVRGTSYAATVDEYTDAAGKSVSSSISYSGHIVDSSAVPRTLGTSTVLGEVCNVVTEPVANAYYPVYVDKKRGNANYCAYHSWGTCKGTPVEFGFFFDLDGDAGCDPQSTVSGESQGLAALANVTGHELSETAPIRMATPGLTAPAKRTTTSARGPSAVPTYCSAQPSGRFRATGRITIMTTTSATQTPATKKAAPTARIIPDRTRSKGDGPVDL